MAHTLTPIRNMRDIEALERVPLAQRLAFNSTYDAIAAGARKFPDRAAMIYLPNGDPDETPFVVSHRQSLEGITRAANLFHTLGLRAGDAVAMLLPMTPQMQEAMWGSQATGICAAINWFLEPEAIAEIVNASGATILLALGPTPGFEIWDKVEAIRDLIPTVRHILRVTAPGTPDPGDIPGVLSYDAEAAKQPGDRLTFARAYAPGGTAMYVHTGGTTSTPRLTQISHDTLIYKNWAYREVMGYTEDEVHWCAGPMFHIGSVVNQGLGALALGITLINPGPWGFRNKQVIRNYWRFVEKFGITRISGQPTVLSALVSVPVGGADLSSLRKLGTCASAPLPVSISEMLEAMTGGVKMTNLYGMTETGANIVVPPRDGEIRYGSSGIRLPYSDVKTVHLDAHGNRTRDCAADEIGVIVCSGPGLTRGYLVPEHNERLFVEPGWLNTGDLGRIDADGYVWITGRAKDLIIRGGHNIDPRIIEETLHRHPDVIHAGAVGKPDAYAGELPVAYVQLVPGSSVTSDELIAFAKANIPERAATPVEIHILDAMPVSGANKIVKQDLRLDIQQRTFDALMRREGIDAEIGIAAHPVHGTMATVRLTAGNDRGGAERRIHAVLDPFAIRHEIVWAGRPAAN